VTSSRVFLRLELALGALWLTAASLAVLVATDALQFHAGALWAGRDLEPHGIVLLVLASADGVVIVRAVNSLVRQVLAQRSFLRALPVRSVVRIEGRPVRVLPGRSLHAFCAGLLRPAVYVSAGTLRAVSAPELRAILAHEHHHRVRRDPLRMVLARAVSNAFRPIPPLATLADEHASLTDLAADAAAHTTWTLAESRTPISEVDATAAKKSKKGKRAKRGRAFKYKGPYRRR
jgi:Zn-dependent protease with chaperone function